jgi:hypothetical protein
MIIRIILGLVFAASVALIPTSAQLPQPDGRGGMVNGDRDLEEHVAAMRYLITLADKRRPKKKDPQLALAELQEDFTQIQLHNKDLVLTSDKSPELDAKFVAKEATEIHKRAERLLSNLALPEAPANGISLATDAVAEPAAIKKAIVKMGWLIYGFTKNPMFREAQVIEAGSAAAARRDLDHIMELSRQIKVSSEILAKAKR